MSDTGDELRELAGIVDHVEDDRGATVRDIDVQFVKRAQNPFAAIMGLGSGERVPVFDLQIAPSDDVEEVDDEDLPADVDDEGVEIDFEDEPAANGGEPTDGQ